MKKLTLIASAMFVGVALSSYGQGQINFQNYNFGATALNAPVTFATDGMDGSTAVTAGWGVGSTFQADLLYQYGTMASYALLTPSSPVLFAFGAAGDGPVDTSTTFAGYFFGNVLTVPGYSGGSINLIVQAYNGSSYDASMGNGLWRGQSEAMTLASIATGTAQPTDLSFSPFTVTTVPVPEPTTIAPDRKSVV